jgi:hypothetical protein
MTTAEYLKNTKEHPQNPFSSSMTRNLKKFCTSRIKKSHNNYIIADRHSQVFAEKNKEEIPDNMKDTFTSSTLR